MPHPEGKGGGWPWMHSATGPSQPGDGDGSAGEEAEPSGPKAKVLTVSDGVSSGTREDRSGRALVTLLESSGFTVVETAVVPDGVVSVAAALASMASSFAGIVVTTGGTGFAPRDQTPEGTREVIEREAPGLAEAMRFVNPLGRLSRGVAGIKGQAIIINTPGSPKGAAECLGAVIDVLPHALALLGDRPTPHM